MWRMAIFIRHICGEQKILLDIAGLKPSIGPLKFFWAQDMQYSTKYIFSWTKLIQKGLPSNSKVRHKKNYFMIRD